MCTRSELEREAAEKGEAAGVRAQVFEVQVRGHFGGTVGDWRPAITGTLTQTVKGDCHASRFWDETSANEAAELVIAAGATPDDVRVINWEMVV